MKRIINSLKECVAGIHLAMTRPLSLPRWLNGQAALEVAVFGAIIIFLIGMIIRTTISTQYTQNQNFKAMRLALAKSLESSKAGKTERNNATVLYIEDRLVPDFNKFGSLERTPFVAQAGGSMSNLLFYPIDEADVNSSITKLDVFINGQYFPFTTNALRAKILVPPLGRSVVNPKDRLPQPVHYKGWNYECKCVKTAATESTPASEMCYACPIFYEIIPNGTPGYCTPDPIVIASIEEEVLYTDTTAPGCGGVLDNALERFDLNQNGNFADDPQPCFIVALEQYVTRGQQHAACWNQVAWQWNGENGIAGFKGDGGYGILNMIDSNNAQYPSYDIDFDRKEETVYGVNRLDFSKMDPAEALRPFTALTAEQSFQINETIRDVNQQITEATKTRATLKADLALLQAQGIVTDVMVLDNQDGDIDLTHDNSSPGTARGLQPETAIYTRIRQANGEAVDQGTYFLVQEGKAYNPETGAFVRSVNKRDQIDLVERHVLLSKNTHRFCINNVPPACIAGLGNPTTGCDVAPNPVEVCVHDENPTERSGCFHPNNVARTCLDTQSNMLYVRSRIVNRGGHKWITDATDKRPAVTIR